MLPKGTKPLPEPMLATGGWMMHDIINIGSGYGLLPNGTKPLPEPMLAIISESCGIHLWQI